MRTLLHDCLVIEFQTFCFLLRLVSHAVIHTQCKATYWLWSSVTSMNHKLNKPHMEDVFYFLNILSQYRFLKKNVCLHWTQTGPKHLYCGKGKRGRLAFKMLSTVFLHYKCSSMNSWTSKSEFLCLVLSLLESWRRLLKSWDIRKDWHFDLKSSLSCRSTW